jgi:hypothetical protein
MTLATERIEEGHKGHEVSRAKIYARYPRWSMVIWCNCGERVVLTGNTSADERVGLPSPTAKEAFYSWLEDHLVRLEGKEVRREYYVRLEGQAASR